MSETKEKLFAFTNQKSSIHKGRDQFTEIVVAPCWLVLEKFVCGLRARLVTVNFFLQPKSSHGQNKERKFGKKGCSET